MPRLILLNGPPGIGKSTLARRYVAEHPDTLHADLDLLRTLIGGWEADFAHAGALIRPAALAFVGGYLKSGHDVVLPQLLADAAQIERFEQAAHAAGAEFVEVLLLDGEDTVVARFHRRGEEAPDDHWHEQVRAIVAAQGGDDLLRDYHRRLSALARTRPGLRVVESTEGEAEATYARLLAALGDGA